MTSINLFDFNLPPELIAQRPPESRGASRLMTLDRRSGEVGHHPFSAFPDFLRPADTLVINNTKVFPARLLASRASGGQVEILLVRSLGDGLWTGMVKKLARLHAGEILMIGEDKAIVEAKLGNGLANVRFRSAKDGLRIIDSAGMVPLPPYIRREGNVPDREDIDRYQTVFAREAGSCAAPTAGLHFTPAILDVIRNRGVNVVEVTLHVGPGTFKPVQCDDIENHVMDPELYSISGPSADTINATRAKGGRIIAVGSTVARTLESAAGPDGYARPGAGETTLFITPGFSFRSTDALLTNFHLPKSTLLIMMSAFAGRERVLSAYAEAISEKYRFFSYGDAIFIS